MPQSQPPQQLTQFSQVCKQCFYQVGISLAFNRSVATRDGHPH